MIYNFRFDRSRRIEILRRLRDEGLLSQGWGGGSAAELRVDQDDFVQKTRNCYDLPTTRKASSLQRMREFSDGDLLVTPHFPENGKVSIHVVDGDFPNCYQYLPNDSTHLNHRIKIKRSYGLNGTISIQNAALVNWRGKLQWLRLPILPLNDLGALFETLVQDLKNDPDMVVEPSDLDQYFEDLRKYLFDYCKKKLADIAASGGNISFETVCERLVTAAGYNIERRHRYDKIGGDADLVCSRQRSDVSPFEMGTLTLLVQIKKHSGTTDAQAVEQLLSLQKTDYPDADAVVMSLADDFSDDAKQLAEDNDVVLLEGDTICTMLLNELTKGVE